MPGRLGDWRKCRRAEALKKIAENDSGRSDDALWERVEATKKMPENGSDGSDDAPGKRVEAKKKQI